MRNALMRFLMLTAALLYGAGANLCRPSGEAIEPWVEVRSAHFVVDSNAGESDARRIALEFERVRTIFHAAFAKFRVDPAQPIVILAARDEATMKMLAPEEWGGDSHIRPSGLFHSDGEKDYVVLRLDGEGTVASILGAPTEQEAASACLTPDGVQIGEFDVVEAGGLFKSNARHQLIDVDEGLFFGRHGKTEGMK